MYNNRMSESHTFACPSCGAALTGAGDAIEIKCQYCGSTVIVPEELRAPPATYDGPPVIEVKNVGPAVAAVGGIIGISFLLPIILTIVSVCVVGVLVLFITNQVQSSIRGAFVVPTIVNGPLLTEIARSPTRAPVTATPGRTATPAPAATAAPFTRILFQDNFADRSSGWEHGVFDGNTRDYTAGGYRMLVAKDTGSENAWVKDGLVDVSVQVDGKQAAGPDEGWFGVLCRAQKSVGAYGFKISSAGRYELVKYKFSDQGSGRVTLERGNVQAGVLSPGTPAHLRADCIGSTLALNVNGHAVTSVKDGDYALGGVGLVAETGPSGKGGVDILFSNFVVTGP